MSLDGERKPEYPSHLFKRTLIQKSFDFIRLKFLNLGCTDVFFMEKKLSLKIHQVIIFQLFSDSIVMKFNMLTVLDGALGFFRVSLSITLTLG